MTPKKQRQIAQARAAAKVRHAQWHRQPRMTKCLCQRGFRLGRLLSRRIYAESPWNKLLSASTWPSNLSETFTVTKISL